MDERIKKYLPEHVCLRDASYDSLNGDLHVIQACLDERSVWPLNEFATCDIDASYDWYLGEIRQAMIQDGLENLYEDEYWNIVDYLEDHDESDIVKQLIKNTDLIPVRIELLSNYDCMNSCWYESQGGFKYKDSYLGDAIDALYLNPAQVKKMLVEKKYKCIGKWPNLPYRNGQEQVSYEEFYDELINCCSSANHLVYLARIRPMDLFDSNFIVDKITIPKGNTCGLFSAWSGGGSLLEAKLQKDVSIRLNWMRKGGYGFRMYIDGKSLEYYSISHVYGVDNTFFGKPLII